MYNFFTHESTGLEKIPEKDHKFHIAFKHPNLAHKKLIYQGPHKPLEAQEMCDSGQGAEKCYVDTTAVALVNNVTRVWVVGVLTEESNNQFRQTVEQHAQRTGGLPVSDYAQFHHELIALRTTAPQPGLSSATGMDVDSDDDTPADNEEISSPLSSEAELGRNHFVFDYPPGQIAKSENGDGSPAETTETTESIATKGRNTPATFSESGTATQAFGIKAPISTGDFT